MTGKGGGDSENWGVNIDVSNDSNASGLRVVPGLNGTGVSITNSNTAGLTNTLGN